MKLIQCAFISRRSSGIFELGVLGGAALLSLTLSLTLLSTPLYAQGAAPSPSLALTVTPDTYSITEEVVVASRETGTSRKTQLDFSLEFQPENQGVFVGSGASVDAHLHQSLRSHTISGLTFENPSPTPSPVAISPTTSDVVERTGECRPRFASALGVLRDRSTCAVHESHVRAEEGHAPVLVGETSTSNIDLARQLIGRPISCEIRHSSSAVSPGVGTTISHEYAERGSSWLFIPGVAGEKVRLRLSYRARAFVPTDTTLASRTIPASLDSFTSVSGRWGEVLPANDSRGNPLFKVGGFTLVGVSSRGVQTWEGTVSRGQILDVSLYATTELPRPKFDGPKPDLRSQTHVDCYGWQLIEVSQVS